MQKLFLRRGTSDEAAQNTNDPWLDHELWPLQEDGNLRELFFIIFVFPSLRSFGCLLTCRVK